MATFPLEFDGQTVGVDKLSGTKYVHAYSELIQQLLRHGAGTRYGYALSPTYIYPVPGKQRVVAQTGRSWVPGQRLLAYKAGSTANWRIVVVRAYDPATGTLDLDVVSSSRFETPEAGVSHWYFTPNFVEQISAASSVISLSGGGTAGYSVETARNGLLLPTNSSIKEWFADFFLNESHVRHVTSTGSSEEVLRTNEFSGQDLVYPYDNSPGIYHLSAAVGQSESVQFGLDYWQNWADFGGAATLFECGLYPSQVSATNYYRFDVGLLGANAAAKFRFECGVNSQRFQVIHGVNSSYTTVNTTTTVTEGVYYKLRIEVSGSNLLFKVNGTTVATVSASSYQSVSASNRMTPMVKVTGISSGMDAEVFVDYLYFRKQFTSGR